jgi:TetR/AcrR family transcriptional repressor of mexJK operon
VPERPAHETGRSAKLRAITEAATAAFLEGGYEGTSLDHIAARAGVSKQTIYNRFGDKEALFRAICRELAGDLLSPLDAARGSDDTRATLSALGRSYLRLALASSSLSLHRLVIQESARFPDFGRAVYQAGPARIVAELADYLREQESAGSLAVGDPGTAAESFLGLLLGDTQLRALLGVARDEAIEARVDAAVDLFFRAFAPEPAV